MSNRVMHVAAVLCLAAGAAVAMDGVAPGVGLASLRSAYPGVRVNAVDGRVISLYGKPMTGGKTPAAAAAKWLKRHSAAFGVGELDLRPTWNTETGQGKFTVFAYQQFTGGLPVEGSVGRVQVLNGGGNPVVYAAGHFSAMPEGGFAPEVFTGAEAMELVQAIPAYANLPEWDAPTLVAFEDREGGRALARAWKFRGDSRDMIGGRRGLTFFVDAATGEVLHARNEILNADITGRVLGKATPGTKPDSQQNPPQTVAIDSVRVLIQGGNNAYTDEAGDYTVVHGGNQQVNVSTTFDFGRWSQIDNLAGAVLSLNQNVTPPGPADFIYNASPLAGNTAQVNAFIHATATHDYIKDRAPGFNALDSAIKTVVNWNSTCNAHYDSQDQSINFYTAGGGCVNTAYTTVVAHEYGHFIVNRLGLTQDAFGEGYGDVMGVMIYDTGIVGEDFFGPGGHIRNLISANKQYPCNGGIHDCGQVLAGFWYDLLQNHKNAFGTDLGRELAKQLNVDWSMVTVGNVAGQSCSPTTAIEVLTSNDDDGDIDNGTPDYAIICAAFGKHNIDCPEIKLIDFAYPDGLPEFVLPGQATVVKVNVVPLTENPVPGTGKVSYRINEGNFTAVSMTELADNQYEATLPVADCFERVHFYFEAKSSGGQTVKDPADAPLSYFLASTPTVDGDILLTDAFESDSGWVSGAPGDNATTGKWNRVDPLPTEAQTGNDHTANGTICWVTDGAGGGLGDFDVDNGKTTLVSPVFDLSGSGDARISYWRWYSNDTGAAPNSDTFRVDISNDNGQTWTNAETVGPDGAETHAGWFFHEFLVGDFIETSSQVKLRFIAEDAGEGSLVEAAVDDFQIIEILCDGGACYGDFNGDGVLDFFDFLAYTNSFNAGEDKADCDGNGALDFFDFLCFQNEFLGGC